MKKELISIVIPVFRVEKYLNRCVESVIKQSYKNIEIIIVDDGSDDNCPAMCDALLKKDDRIVVYHKENGGLSDARNYGLERANGKYISFIDSDDTVDVDYVKQLYETLIENNADISVCGYTVVYDNGKIIPNSNDKKMVLSQKETLEKILYQEDFNVATWAKMYKIELFKGIRFPKGKIFEDSFTTYKLVFKSSKIACNMKSQYNYLIRSNSILTSSFSEKKLTLIDAYDEMGEAVLKTYPDLEKAVLRGKAYSRISTLRQMINCKPRLRNKEKELRKEILENKKILLFDKRVSKRDKAAICCLLISTSLFRIVWNLYCKITGRNM